MEILILLLLLPPFIWLGVFFYKRIKARLVADLEEWAKRKGYKILELEFRIFRKGPYLFRSNPETQLVWFITIDDNGQERKGFVKQGTFVRGLTVRTYQIRWVQPGTKETLVEDITSNHPTLNAEQGDADQPATAVDSKSEGKEKPQPESEGRSQ